LRSDDMFSHIIYDVDSRDPGQVRSVVDNQDHIQGPLVQIETVCMSRRKATHNQALCPYLFTTLRIVSIKVFCSYFPAYLFSVTSFNESLENQGSTERAFSCDVSSTNCGSYTPMGRTRPPLRSDSRGCCFILPSPYFIGRSP
jgi:hypothetical protein